MKIQFLLKSLPFLVVAAISTAQQGHVAPRPVTQASYAKHHDKLYVYGGQGPQGIGSGQFFALDLSIPWKSASPAWSRLPDGPVMPYAGAVISQDGKIFIAIVNGDGLHNPRRQSGQQFIFEQNSWENFSHYDLWNSQSPVVMKTDGRVLAEVGIISTAELQNITRFYSFESGSWLTEHFPTPTTTEAYFPRMAHKAVWSDYLESVVFHGGFNVDIGEVQTPDNPHILKLYHPRSKKWTWKTTQDFNSRYINQCAAITDDGKRLFVYGGSYPEYTRDDFAILDLETFRWSKTVTKGPLRWFTVCTITGDHFLLWGGDVVENRTITVYDAGQSSTPVFIYKISTQQWVEDYIPSVGYTPAMTTSSTPSSSSTSSPPGHKYTSASEEGSESTFSVGYLASGAAGALIAIILVGFLVWKRRRQRTRNSLPQGNLSVDDDPKSFAADGRHDGQVDDASGMSKNHQMTMLRAPQEGRNGDIGASMSATASAPAPHYPSWGANFDGTYAFDLSQVNYASNDAPNPRSGRRSTSRSDPAPSPSPPKWPVESASTPASSSSPPSDMRISRQARNPQGLDHHNESRQNQEQSHAPGGRRSKERPGPQWRSR